MDRPELQLAAGRPESEALVTAMVAHANALAHSLGERATEIVVGILVEDRNFYRVEAVQRAMDRTMVFGLIFDLKHAVRGGRVKPVHKRIADFLRVAVVLKLNNTAGVTPGGIISLKSNPVNAFSGYVRRRIDPAKTYRIAIGHAQNPARAEELEREIRHDIPSIESVHIAELGAHGGPGTMTIAAQEYSKP